MINITNYLVLWTRNYSPSRSIDYVDNRTNGLLLRIYDIVGKRGNDKGGEKKLEGGEGLKKVDF